MYEISKDYLNKLLQESGVKLGGAKHSAMIEIINLLDEHSLEGLLKSIREDYDSACKTIASAQKAFDDRNRSWQAVEELKREYNKIFGEITGLRETKKAEEKELSLLRHEKNLAGCTEEDTSKVRAFKAAIDIAFDAVKNQTSVYEINAATVQQILRSAANVVGGYVPMANAEQIEIQNKKRMKIL